MKKILLTFFSILSLLFTSPALVFAAGSTLSLSPATGTFNKNCNFSLQILLNTGGYDTAGTDVILNYDASRFIANKINNGSVYSEYPGNNIDTQNGTITVSGITSAASSFKGSGILATIDFTVLDTAPVGATQIKFNFNPNDKSNTSDTNVVETGTMVETLDQVVNGNYVIGSGVCGQGGPVSTGSATITQAPPAVVTSTPLPDTADSTTILALILIGGSLSLVGLFSLAKLR